MKKLWSLRKRQVNEVLVDSYARRWNLGAGTVVNTEGVATEILDCVTISAGPECEIDLRGLATVNSSVSIHMDRNCRIVFGAGTMVNGDLRCFMHEPSAISIGTGCLIGGGDLWTSDMHSILDKQTGLRINPAADIVIGDRVWLGRGVLVLKGSSIGDDSVVGARSLVSGGILPPNSVIAGAPAKVIKSDVTWDFRLV
jgi:acetyltransferase-like isoleucine patch superfamily enzyme